MKTEGDPSKYYLFGNRTFHVCFWLEKRSENSSFSFADFF
jgi:hypothetical protein